MDDEDPLVTAMDGTRLDVTVDVQMEMVMLVTERSEPFDLTPRGALELSDQLRAAAQALRSGDIAQA